MTLGKVETDYRSLCLENDAEALLQQGYVLKGKIGAGSFASVYEAESREFGNNRLRLACKVFDTSKVPKEYREKFFPRELDILMTLSHENIITAHCILQRGPKVFIFMHLAEGGDLLSWIQNKGPVEEKLARFWFQQLISAMQYLHSREIAHRDLKCENILLTKRYNIKVADFGFARYCMDETGRRILSRTFCGSASYAAPEILHIRSYNPKIADIWSLGVVLFIMLDATMPFDDTNINQLLNDQILKQWAFRRKVSRLAQSLVRKILEPDVTRRIRLDAMLRHPWVMLSQAAGDWVPRHTNLDRSRKKQSAFVITSYGRKQKDTIAIIVQEKKHNSRYGLCTHHSVIIRLLVAADEGRILHEHQNFIALQQQIKQNDVVAGTNCFCKILK